MYRNIKLHKDDQVYHLIFWRENPSQPLALYKLTTVTYGVNSSPYMAIKTLHQLANDEGEHFPNASKILCEQTYVDDVIGGADTEDEASALQEELIQLLKKGGFELRKWTSNSSRLLRDLPQELQEVPVFLQSINQPHFSILGLYWCSTTDTFSYKFSFSDGPITKRHCLSWVAQIYDPSGWLSPVTMWAKCFIQLLWAKGLDWDTPLSTELSNHWLKFINCLDQLENLKIPRSFQIGSSKSISLCGFSDASESGYAAVVFLRCENNDSTTIRQVIAKTKVAPLKKLSLPRLELCASHLLSRLLEYCVSILQNHCTISRVYAWTDSTLVLTWIKTPSYRLKTFVANRVANIQEAIPAHLWAHVSSSQNPADCASRGLLPSQLEDQSLWWSGPTWLQSAPSEWPNSKFIPVDLDFEEETKKTSATVLVTTPQEEWNLLTTFSSWTKLQYVMAYILRFLYNVSHEDKRTGFLTTYELKESMLKIFLLVQKTEFSKDIDRLKANQQCSTKLQRLSPFIDTQGLIRVGGRLKNSNIPYQVKHSVILPKSHHVTKLLIQHCHVKHLHSGPQLTQALLSQFVWILSARSVIRSCIHKCIPCFKCKPRNTPPLMGELPEARVTPAKCFLRTGIDMAGPYNVKAVAIRNLKHCKVYICIFVCFTTKAVHLEIVSDLTTEAFLAALTRFVSRRGLCQDIFSDCGTNFIGANNQIQSIMKAFWKHQIDKNLVNDFCIQRSIDFHFNPPTGAQQGGLWESAVKSMKFHFRRVVGETILTYEEFHTLTTRVEAILNSRPLTPLSSDPVDLSVLTPGHFLTGGPLSAVPEPEFSPEQNYLRRWQRVQAYSQHLWQRWSKEYLFTLQQRLKWNVKTSNIKIGDLVLIQDCRTSSLSWPLGRVVGISPGKDNIVRVVQIKTTSGVLTRPAVKVFPLPMDST